MGHYIMVGCDVSDRSLMIAVANGTEGAQKKSFANNSAGRARMVHYLRERSAQQGGAQIVFAYEAGPHGFGLYDEMTAQEIRTYMFAPTRLAQSVKSRKDKTDEKDAVRILEALRGSLLAGNRMPSIWIPDIQTRDDREVVRSRFDAGGKARAVRVQIRMLLKRNALVRPEPVGSGWTQKFRAWLRGLIGPGSPLADGAQVALETLLRQLEAIEKEIAQLDESVARLSTQARYSAAATALLDEAGVGMLTAMAFLTEIGDMTRFNNRQQLGAYLGLTASQYLTGNVQERRGHITKQGPWRLRAVLSQAQWTRVREGMPDRDRYERLVRENPKRKKLAIVACMRRLGIRLWHVAGDAQRGDPPSRPPQRGEAPIHAVGESHGSDGHRAQEMRRRPAKERRLAA